MHRTTIAACLVDASPAVFVPGDWQAHPTPQPKQTSTPCKCPSTKRTSSKTKLVLTPSHRQKCRYQVGKPPHSTRQTAKALSTQDTKTGKRVNGLAHNVKGGDVACIESLPRNEGDNELMQVLVCKEGSFTKPETASSSHTALACIGDDGNAPQHARALCSLGQSTRHCASRPYHGDGDIGSKSVVEYKNRIHSGQSSFPSISRPSQEDIDISLAEEDPVNNPSSRGAHLTLSADLIDFHTADNLFSHLSEETRATILLSLKKGCCAHGAYTAHELAILVAAIIAAKQLTFTNSLFLSIPRDFLSTHTISVDHEPAKDSLFRQVGVKESITPEKQDYYSHKRPAVRSPSRSKPKVSGDYAPDPVQFTFFAQNESLVSAKCCERMTDHPKVKTWRAPFPYNFYTSHDHRYSTRNVLKSMGMNRLEPKDNNDTRLCSQRQEEYTWVSQLQNILKRQTHTLRKHLSIIDYDGLTEFTRYSMERMKTELDGVFRYYTSEVDMAIEGLQLVSEGIARSFIPVGVRLTKPSGIYVPFPGLSINSFETSPYIKLSSGRYPEEPFSWQIPFDYVGVSNSKSTLSYADIFADTPNDDQSVAYSQCRSRRPFELYDLPNKKLDTKPVRKKSQVYTQSKIEASSLIRIPTAENGTERSWKIDHRRWCCPINMKSPFRPRCSCSPTIHEGTHINKVGSFARVISGGFHLTSDGIVDELYLQKGSHPDGDLICELYKWFTGLPSMLFSSYTKILGEHFETKLPIFGAGKWHTTQEYRSLRNAIASSKIDLSHRFSGICMPYATTLGISRSALEMIYNEHWTKGMSNSTSIHETKHQMRLFNSLHLPTRENVDCRSVLETGLFPVTCPGSLLQLRPNGASDFPAVLASKVLEPSEITVIQPHTNAYCSSEVPVAMSPSQTLDNLALVPYEEKNAELLALHSFTKVETETSNGHSDSEEQRPAPVKVKTHGHPFLALSRDRPPSPTRFRRRTWGFSKVPWQAHKAFDFKTMAVPDRELFSPIELSQPTERGSGRHSSLTYASLLDRIIKAARLAKFPSQDNSVPRTRRLYREMNFGYPPTYACLNGFEGLERRKRMGAAGELYVFELLKSMDPPLPDFTHDAWMSSVRHFVAPHPDYSDMTEFAGMETTDIVYDDSAGVLTAALIENGYLDREKWSGRRLRYYIEVKTTIGKCDKPFFMTDKQYTRLSEISKTCRDEEGREAISLIFRVYNLDKEATRQGRIRYKLYADPASLEARGLLKSTFVGPNWAFVEGGPDSPEPILDSWSEVGA